MERRIILERQTNPSGASLPAATPTPTQVAGGSKMVALGADHGGYELKEILKSTDLDFIKNIYDRLEKVRVEKKEAR